MVRTGPFKCPNCGTLYQVVKTDAGPETVGRQIKCRLNYLIDMGNAVIVDVEPTPARTYDEVEFYKNHARSDRAAFSFEAKAARR